jgi:hypothetical protein
MTHQQRHLVVERVWQAVDTSGARSRRRLPEPTRHRGSVLLWTDHPVFARRLLDAVIRLRRGEEKQEIRQLHGGVVLRAAMEDVGIQEKSA